MKQVPDRNEQFENIATLVAEFEAAAAIFKMSWTISVTGGEVFEPAGGCPRLTNGTSGGSRGACRRRDLGGVVFAAGDRRRD